MRYRISPLSGISISDVSDCGVVEGELTSTGHNDLACHGPVTPRRRGQRYVWTLVRPGSLWTPVISTSRYRIATSRGATGGRLGFTITPSSTTSTLAPG